HPRRRGAAPQRLGVVHHVEQIAARRAAVDHLEQAVAARATVHALEPRAVLAHRTLSTPSASRRFRDAAKPAVAGTPWPPGRGGAKKIPRWAIRTRVFVVLRGTARVP